MSLAIKKGVRIQGLHPEMLVALQVAESVYRAWDTHCVITSARDGKHGSGSLHFKGYAIDIRSKTLPRADLDEAVGELRHRLGAEFDVVLESIGRPGEHIHIEFDPKFR